MSSDSITEAILAHAESIEARIGQPTPDPSLEHVPVGADALVHQIVYSMMLWESTHEMAANAMDLLRRSVVDFNELRVCSEAELCDLLPRNCPRREERTSRLLAALNDIFLREHGLSLATVAAMPKREARQYLDALGGLPQFAIARVMLLVLGGHAFPADERLVRRLRGAGVIDADGADANEVGARLERAVRAADAPRIYALLEADAAANPPTTARARKSPRKPPRDRKGTPPDADAPAEGAAPGNSDGTES